MNVIGYVRIPLRRRDGTIAAHALIDASDVQAVEGRWYLGSRGYAQRQFRDPDDWRRIRGEFMHRRILGLKQGDGLEVDHINRDKLDNRRGNLRVVSHSENEQNKAGTTSSSGYRNVVWYASKQRYVARLMVDGKWKTKGGFSDPKEAALAADALRREWHPCAP